MRENEFEFLNSRMRRSEREFSNFQIQIQIKIQIQGRSADSRIILRLPHIPQGIRTSDDAITLENIQIRLNKMQIRI